MRAFLFATGEDNFLHPLTAAIPPPMLPVLNRPIMAYVIEILARQGIKEILASLWSMPDVIETYFGDGRRWGANIKYELQRDAKGSAGALRWAKSGLDSTFLFMPATCIANFSIDDLLKHHRDHQSTATVVISRDGMNTPSNPIYLDENEAVASTNPGCTDPANWVDTGIYLFEPQVLDFVPPNRRFDIHHQLLPLLLKNNLPVNGYELEGYWNDLSSYERYFDLHKILICNNWEKPLSPGNIPAVHYPSLNGKEVRENVWVNHNSFVHPTARLTPPVYIGENCWIGQKVELGPNAFLNSYDIVNDEATISNSVILDYTYVGKLVNIANRLVSRGTIFDVATGTSAHIVDTFLLGQTNQVFAQDIFVRLFSITLALLLLFVASPIICLLALYNLFKNRKILDAIPQVKAFKTKSLSGKITDTYFNLYRFSIPPDPHQTDLFHKMIVRFELFRLPELFNVLKGDLNFIGVKSLSPIEAAYVKEFWNQHPYEYHPGYVGLWYIQTGRQSKLDETMVTDAYFSATRSWKNDLQILLKTPSAWLRRIRTQLGSE